MNINIMNANDVSKSLPGLIQKHEKIDIAVAWGSMTVAASELFKHTKKFGSVLVGLDFLATDPDFLDKLVGVPKAFAAKSASGCFHPKIYYFQSGQQAEAIIGSANFTRGGLGKNLEACVHLQGEADQSVFEQIRRTLESYQPLRLPITKELAESYRRQWNRRPPKVHPIFPSEGKRWASINSPLGTMSWENFAEAAQKDPHHGFSERIKLLRKIQQMFALSPSLSELSPIEWKGIAGVVGPEDAESPVMKGFEWQWFGSMRGAGSFAKLIGLRDTQLAKAIENIPARGEVDAVHYRKFKDKFVSAFADEERSGNISSATRLLAMKRPDCFVCVNNGNKKPLAKALSFAPTTLTLDNYWERVIEPIRSSPWYNATRPVGQDAELWDNRTAMLDAIYYEPV